MKWPIVAVTLCSMLVLSACMQSSGNEQIQNLELDTPDLLDGSEKIVRKTNSLTLADLRAKYSSTFVLNGPTDKREMALTFDDGPDEKFTPLVLDELKKAGVHATFFVVGNRVEANPDIFKRIINEGHAIGNHSYDHANLPKLSDKQFKEQINRTDLIISSYLGYEPAFVRPPYGAINENQILWLAGEKKKIINWNVDSLDWKGLSADEVYTNVMGQTKPGSIILQHSAGGDGEDLSGSVKAIATIVAKLKQDNVSFVTIPDMFDSK